MFVFFNEETRDATRLCHCMRNFTHFQVHCTVTMHTWGFNIGRNQVIEFCSLYIIITKFAVSLLNPYNYDY